MDEKSPLDDTLRGSSQGSAVLYMRPHGLGSLRVATENRRCTSELPLTGSSAKGSVGQN